MSNIQLESVVVDNSAGAAPTYDLATPITKVLPTNRTSKVSYVLRNRGTANAYVRAAGSSETETAMIVPPTGLAVEVGPYLWNTTKSYLPVLVLATGAVVAVTPIQQGV